jgi:FdhD protein
MSAPAFERSLAFEAVALPLRADAPRMSRACHTLLRQIEVVDEFGDRRELAIPAERPLTVFIDKQELVTLMTLGAAPELLVLGYLINQDLIEAAGEIESIDVDWEVNAAAIKTFAGIKNFAEKTAHRVVTTGCGQGTGFGDAIGQFDRVQLPTSESARIDQATLVRILGQMRVRDSVHRQAGSVHGCALFKADEALIFAEDVGRHNAIDTVAGWMSIHGVSGGDKIFYTTGRLTSEMTMKAAHMGVPIIISRNGVTEMGHDLATRLGMTLFGRAANRHFLCYSGFERFDAAPDAKRRVLTPVPVE